MKQTDSFRDKGPALITLDTILARFWLWNDKQLGGPALFVTAFLNDCVVTTPDPWVSHVRPPGTKIKKIVVPFMRFRTEVTEIYSFWLRRFLMVYTTQIPISMGYGLISVRIEGHSPKVSPSKNSPNVRNENT